MKRNKNWTKEPKHTKTNKQSLPPPRPTHQKYERGKRMELDITRDLPASFESCSLVLGSLFEEIIPTT